MDFFATLNQRRSVRTFQPRTVEPEKLEAVLGAANSAPSAGNLQAYEIYLVERDNNRKALGAAAFGQHFLAEAPLALVFAANPDRAAPYGARGRQLYALQDATIACTFAMLAATAVGLATTWVGAFDEERVRRIIEAPAGERPIAILPLGYPAESPAASSRRRVRDLVHRVHG